MSNTLYILRHAKAAAGSDDRSRPLDSRGVGEAQIMGKYFSVQKIAPQAVRCSPSTRTRATLDLVQEKSHKFSVEYDDRLYLASDRELTNLIAALPDTINSLMLVGHNPGLHELAIKLAKTGDEKKLRELTMEFPPCSFVEISFECDWRDIAKSRGTLKRFVTPAAL